MKRFSPFLKRAQGVGSNGGSSSPPIPAPAKPPTSSPLPAATPSPATPTIAPTPSTGMGGTGPGPKPAPPIAPPSTMPAPLVGMGGGVGPKPATLQPLQPVKPAPIAAPKPQVKFQATYKPPNLGDTPNSGNDFGKMLGHLAPAMFPMVAPHIGAALGLPGLFALADATGGTNHLSTIFGPDKDNQPSQASQMGQAAAMGLPGLLSHTPASNAGGEQNPLPTFSNAPRKPFSETPLEVPPTAVTPTTASPINTPFATVTPTTAATTDTPVSANGAVPTVQPRAQQGWTPWGEMGKRQGWKPGDPKYDAMVQYAKSDPALMIDNPDPDEVRRNIYRQEKGQWQLENAGYAEGSSKFRALQAELAANNPPGGPAPETRDVWNYAVQKGIVDPSRTDDDFDFIKGQRSKDTSIAGDLINTGVRPQSVAPVAAPAAIFAQAAPKATERLARSTWINNRLTQVAAPLAPVLKKVPAIGAALDLADRYIGTPTWMGGRGLGEGKTTIEEDTARFNNLVNNPDRTMGGYLYEIFNSPVASAMAGNSVLNHAQELGRAAAGTQRELDTARRAKSVERVEQLKAIAQRTPGEEADYQAAQANVRESDMDQWFKNQKGWSGRFWHDAAGREFRVPGLSDHSVHIPGTSIPINPLAGTGTGRQIGNAIKSIGDGVSRVQDVGDQLLKPITQDLKAFGESFESAPQKTLLDKMLARAEELQAKKEREEFDPAREQALQDSGTLDVRGILTRGSKGEQTPMDRTLISQAMESLDAKVRQNRLEPADIQLMTQLSQLTYGTPEYARLQTLKGTPQFKRLQVRSPKARNPYFPSSSNQTNPEYDP